jgi:hypothetical protein
VKTWSQGGGGGVMELFLFLFLTYMVLYAQIIFTKLENRHVRDKLVVGLDIKSAWIDLTELEQSSSTRL